MKLGKRELVATQVNDCRKSKYCETRSSTLRTSKNLSKAHRPAFMLVQNQRVNVAVQMLSIGTPRVQPTRPGYQIRQATHNRKVAIIALICHQM